MSRRTELRLVDYLELTLRSPKENVCYDETLLDTCERTGHEVLRVWESPAPCVVAGRSNRSFRDVNLEVCSRLGIPILSRRSGGGTVLLAPGCLNYGVTLDIGRRPELSTIRATNDYAMGRLRRTVSEVTGRRVEVAGFTDLIIGDRKFSGNAQHRRRRAILVHGTILYGLDLELVEAALGPPLHPPEYRRERSHRDFLMNLQESPDRLKAALVAEWGAAPASGPGTTDASP